ncbi:MAG: biotin transporter BioY [Rhizobiaceae bacterium]|nr:biotin transporter BioY [Rhizobiaceae bacterium]
MATTLDTLSQATGGSLAKQALLVVGGSLFLAGLSQVAIGAPVPMTLQTLAVMLIGLTFGARLAVATVLLYLAQGAAGLPVFAGFAGGAQHLVGPTAGYLAGFVVGAGVIGLAADRGLTRNWAGAVLALLAGLVVIFGLGALWLGHVIGYDKAIAAGVTPFILGDVIKLVLAALIGKGVLKGASSLARL